MTNMDLPSRELTAERLLDCLHFEDDQWLWEVVWALNARCPKAGQDEKVGLARQAVFELLADGLIELWRGEWPGGPVEPLSPAQIERLRVDPMPWYDPEHTELLVVIREQVPSDTP
jgi:hypothetical protein